MAYIRVKDKDTRHEFDVLETDWRIKAGILEHVKPKLYPPSAQPRRPKHYKPASRMTPDQTTEEANNG